MDVSTEGEVESSGGFRGIRLNEFEGPLDLLIFLIKKNEINIFDIPIARITEQFLSYLTAIPDRDLEEISDFYAEAATLLLIKSKMLLPIEANLDDEYEDPRQELVERLIEYQKYKKLSNLMEVKEEEWLFDRKRLERPLPFDEEEVWEKADVWDLLKIFSGYTRSLSSERIIDLYEEVSINEKITLLFEILEEKKECRFEELLVKTGSVMHFICSFLALLEAAKQHLILVYQNRMFGDIVIRWNS